MISFSIPAPIRKLYDQNKDLFKDCGLNFRSASHLLSLFAFGFKNIVRSRASLPWQLLSFLSLEASSML